MTLHCLPCHLSVIPQQSLGPIAAGCGWSVLGRQYGAGEVWAKLLMNGSEKRGYSHPINGQMLNMPLSLDLNTDPMKQNERQWADIWEKEMWVTFLINCYTFLYLLTKLSRKVCKRRYLDKKREEFECIFQLYVSFLPSVGVVGWVMNSAKQVSPTFFSGLVDKREQKELIPSN